MGDYCNLTDVKNRLTDLGTDYDTLITELCTNASRIFDKETGRRFDATTATKYFPGTGGRKLYIPELASVTSIKVRTAISGSWRIVPITPVEGDRLGDVILCPEGRDSTEPAMWLRFIDSPAGPDSIWPAGDATVEIAGSWGFAAVPADVKDATIELVVAMLRDRGASTGTATGVGDFDQPGRIRTYPDLTYRVMQRRKLALVA